jgi:hypothetical protein
MYDIHLSVQNCNFIVYTDDTVVYAIAPTADKALSEFHSAFIALQKAFVELKLVLNAGKNQVHYMTKSMWTPARRTSHCKIMGINMELVHPLLL